MMGCVCLSTPLDKIAGEIKRANDLKEVELRSRNVAITEPGSTVN